MVADAQGRQRQDGLIRDSGRRVCNAASAIAMVAAAPRLWLGRNTEGTFNRHSG
jgi:hypothetical protein